MKLSRQLWPQLAPERSQSKDQPVVRWLALSQLPACVPALQNLWTRLPSAWNCSHP